MVLAPFSCRQRNPEELVGVDKTALGHTLLTGLNPERDLVVRPDSVIKANYIASKSSTNMTRDHHIAYGKYNGSVLSNVCVREL